MLRSEERVDGEVPTDAQANQVLVPALKGTFKVIDVAEENELVKNMGDTIKLLNSTIDEIVTAHRR